MKKIVKSSLFVLAAVAVSVACSKEMSPVTPGNQVTITAYIPDELTKVSFTPDANLDGPVKIAWEDLDKIRVIDHNDATDNSQFAIQPGFTAHQASFSGTAVEATSYDILYPGTMESAAEAEAVQFGIQTQINNANAAQLAYMALLSNVNTYENVEFSEAWATAHGGSFKQTGILRLRIQLPDGFTDDVASVTVNAPSALFYKSNALISKEKVSSLKLNFTGAGATPDAGVITGYVMLPWENVTIAANTTLSVIVETADHKFYTKSFTPSTTEDVVLTMGRVNAIKINKTGFGAASTTFAGGSGTAADPWLIATPAHMQNISANLEEDNTKYFKMIDDVDMDGITWTPIVNISPFNKYIDFDGNNKRIINLSCATGYASLFGIFFGNARNFTIKDAIITAPSGKRVGAFAGMIGTGSFTYASSISNVTIENCAVGTNVLKASTSAGIFAGEIRRSVTLSNVQVKGGSVYGTSYAGGLIGQSIITNDITACSVYDAEIVGNQGVGGIIGFSAGGTVSKCFVSNVTVNGSAAAGGIVGKEQTNTIEIRNCWSSGEIQASGNTAGGIIGDLVVSGSGVYNCYSKATVKSQIYTGGIVGRANNAAKGNATNNDNKSTNNHVENCIAWNDLIQGISTDNLEHYSNGAIVGSTATKNYLIDCKRKYNLSFEDNPKNVELGGYSLTDQENADNATSMVKGTGTYSFGYHGKAAASDATVKSVAIALGWDSAIWDFSTDLPTLK